MNKFPLTVDFNKKLNPSGNTFFAGKSLENRITEKEREKEKECPQNVSLKIENVNLHWLLNIMISGLLKAVFTRLIFQRLPEKRRKIIHHHKRSRLYNFTLMFYEKDARSLARFYHAAGREHIFVKAKLCRYIL